MGRKAHTHKQKNGGGDFNDDGYFFFFQIIGDGLVEAAPSVILSLRAERKRTSWQEANNIGPTLEYIEQLHLTLIFFLSNCLIILKLLLKKKLPFPPLPSPPPPKT